MTDGESQPTSPGGHRQDIRALWRINKYLWMTLGLLLLYLPAAQWHGLLRIPIVSAIALFALAFVNGATRSYLAFRRAGFLPERLSWLFTSVDITLLALVIHFTSGIHSDLWLVYFVVLMFESMDTVRRHHFALILAVTIGLVAGVLPLQINHGTDAIPWQDFVRILLCRLFFLALTASLVRRISQSARERDQELSLLREQMATTEERGRIAREIHDSLGHAMVSSILRLELAARLARKSPDETESILKEEIPALRAAWNEGRDLAFHLRPWDNDNQGEPFTEMLRRHIGTFSQRSAIEIDYRVVGKERPLTAAATFGLKRIVQESLTNALRHAHASHISVVLAFPVRSGVVCTIRDNGTGFRRDRAMSGVGLETMRERAATLGGTLTIESSPENGTEVIVTLP